MFRAQGNLGIKYGVSPEKAAALVEMAVRMKMNLMKPNVEHHNDTSSFHVGFGCLETAAFSRATTAARVRGQLSRVQLQDQGQPRRKLFIEIIYYYYWIIRCILT